MPADWQLGGPWTFDVLRCDAIEECRDAGGEWDVVIFRPEDHREQRPADVLDSLRQLAPEATFLAVCEDSDIREAVSYE